MSDTKRWGKFLKGIRELEAKNTFWACKHHTALWNKHYQAEEPGELFWNEVNGLQNKVDLDRICELETDLDSAEWRYHEAVERYEKNIKAWREEARRLSRENMEMKQQLAYYENREDRVKDNATK